jgi:FkbM family methyltransferase
VLGRTTDRVIARFGWRRGLRLLAQMRLAQYAPAGTLVRTDVPTLRAPAHLRARTTDREVLKQLLLEDHFDFPVAEEPRFIIDAGANIGLTSAYLATRFPRAKIVALEIDAGNYALLQRNTEPYPNVTALHAGLWSHPADLIVENPREREWAFRAAESSGREHTRTVPGLTVGDLARRFGVARVDVLKIDIEGGEREVFGPTAEQWLDQVTLIAVELHDFLVHGCEQVVTSRLGGRFGHSKVGEYDIFVRVDAARGALLHASP